MNILNRIINWFYKEKIFENSPENILVSRSNKAIEFVKYNPASGLPMMGGLDISGNLYGTFKTEDCSTYRR